jgi:hypothetical protein
MLPRSSRFRRRFEDKRDCQDCSLLLPGNSFLTGNFSRSRVQHWPTVRESLARPTVREAHRKKSHPCGHVLIGRTNRRTQLHAVQLPDHSLAHKHLAFHLGTPRGQSSQRSSQRSSSDRPARLSLSPGSAITSGETLAELSLPRSADAGDAGSSLSPADFGSRESRKPIRSSSCSILGSAAWSCTLRAVEARRENSDLKPDGPQSGCVVAPAYERG